MPKKIEVPEGMAHCGKCKQILPKDRFHPTLKNRNGVDGYCKQCRRGYHRVKYDQSARVIPPPGHHYCPHCDKIKSDDNFHPQLLAQKQLRSLYCKQCRSDINYREPRRNSAQGGKQYGVKHQSFKPLIMPLTTDSTRLSYAAGMFDSEGSAQIMPSSVGTPVLVVHGDSALLMSTMQNILGGQLKFYERLKSFKDGSKAIVSNGKLFICRLAEVHAAATALAPYVSLKKKRIETIIKATESSPAERVELRASMDEMNQKCVKEKFDIPPEKYVSIEKLESLGENEYAYLSGVIDGDGWIGYYFGRPIINVTVTKFEFVKRIYDTFGGFVNAVQVQDHQASVVGVKLYLDCDRGRVILKRAIPYLILKKKHAELALCSLDMSRDQQRIVARQMRELTKKARFEKFERVKNQLEEFKKQIVYEDDGVTIKEILKPILLKDEPESVEFEGEEDF